MYTSEESWIQEDSPLSARKQSLLFDEPIERATMQVDYASKLDVFRQGDAAESIYYVRQGTVKLMVRSKHGKEAIIAVLGPGEFFGEECLAGRHFRIATATTVTQAALTRIEKKLMTRLLQEQGEVAESFMAHLLSRNLRYGADLADHLFNSSEERLARNLVLLSNFGKEGNANTVISGINQESLAQMVGTTRSRVSHFMTKFKKRGFIDYGEGGFTVKRGLRRIVLDDQFLL